ncbi:carboxylesterase family protein, partial [bacterium]|nr:carboxylesterase family protein [bacterium]
QMQSTMMNAWASFARSGAPDTGKNIPWKKFKSEKRYFMKLDNNALSMEQDMLSMEDLLNSIQLSAVGSLLEKCLLVRETIENIGDPLEDVYAKWNKGACAKFDINAERKKIEDQLIAQYGSVSVYGD